MKKFIACALVLILAAIMAVALVACGPGKISVPDDENVNKHPVDTAGEMPDALAVLNEIGASLAVPNGNLHFDITVPLTIDQGTLNERRYMMAIKGNLPTTEGGELELMFQVKEGDSVAFGLYITQGKVLFEVLDNASGKTLKFYLEEVNANALYDIISGIDGGALIGKLDELLGGIAGLGLSVGMIVDLIVPMLFTVDSYKSSATDKDIQVSLGVSSLLELVGPLLGSLGLDGLLADAGVNVTGLGDFLGELLGNIPKFRIQLNSYIIDGVSEKFEVKWIDKSETETIGFGCDVKFATVPAEIEFPTNFDEYESFSLTNIAFNINFNINTKSLDVGKFINRFIPNTLPEDLLIFTSDIGFVLKLNMDLDAKDNDKNLILLELYMGSDTGANGNRLLGAYFVDGTLKVNVDEFSSAINVPNIEIIGLNISGLIDDLFSFITDSVGGLLDSLLGSGEEAASAANSQTLKTYDDIILPVSVDKDGDPLIPADLTAFVNAIASVFGMQDYIKLEGDKLEITVNDAFFDSLVQLVPSLEESLKDFPSIGEAKLAVNFSTAGLDSINVTWKPNADENEINVCLDNFLFGFSTPDLEKTIRTRIANKEYVNNLSELINGALDGVNMRAGIALEVKAGNYDIAEILAPFGLELPSLPFRVPSNTKLEAELKIQFAYDSTDVNNSKALIEIHLKEDFAIFEAGKLIGAYMIGDDLYLEVNGISDLTVPKIKIKTDIMTLLKTELEKLKVDFDMSGMLDGLFPDSSGGAETAANAYGSGSIGNGTAYDSITNIIDLGINEEALTLHLTSVALQKLLAQFGVILELPEIDITAEVKDLDDFKIGVNLMNMLSVNIEMYELNIGSAVNVEIPDINEDDYSGDLQSLVNNILKGVELDVDLDLTLYQGFDIAALLEEMGVIIPFELDLALESDIVLDANLKVQMAYDPTNDNNTKLLVELTLNEKILFFEKGKFLSIYGSQGKTYIEVAPIKGIRLPKIAIDIDIMKMISDEIDKIDLDFVLELINNSGASDVSATAGEEKPTPDYGDGDLSIVLMQDYIALYVTGLALNELLQNFGVGGITLPDFDAEVIIKDLDTIWLDFSMAGKISLSGKVNNLTIGRPINIDLPNISDDEYMGTLDKIIGNILKGVDIEADLSLTLKEGNYDLTALLRMFGAVIPNAMLKIDRETQLDLKLKLQIAYDDVAPQNSKLKLELFMEKDLLKLITGSTTVPFIAAYGIGDMVFLEVNNVTGLHIPKVSVQVDIFEMLLAELAKIDIQSLISGGSDDATVIYGSGGSVATANDVINIDINQETIMLAATSKAIANLLGDIGFELPNFDLSAKIEGFENITIDVNNFYDMINLSIMFKLTKLGGDVAVELPEINPHDYNGNLSELVEGILDGVDIQFGLQMTLNKGTYNIADMLNGIPGLSLPPIQFDVLEDTILDLGLKIMMQYRGVNSSDNKALIEFELKEDVAFAKKGNIISIYSVDGYVYIQLSNIIGVNIPKVKVECDLMQLLSDVIADLDIDFIINSSIPGGDSARSAYRTAYGTQEGGGSGLDLTINPDSLRLVVTSYAIVEIIKMINPDMDIVLPEFDITADIVSLSNIIIKVNFESILTMNLSVTSLVIGDSSVNVVLPPIIDGEYVGDLSTLIKDVMKGVDLEANATLTFDEGNYNIADLLKLFGIDSKDIFFNVEEETKIGIQFKLQLTIDPNDSTKSAALLELDILYDSLIFKQGRLLAMYLTNGATYLEVSPDGAIDGLKIPKVKLKNDLLAELVRIIDDLAIDFVLDPDLIVGGDSYGSDSRSGISTVASGDSITVTVDQKSLQLAVTSQAIALLLGQFGIDIDLPEFDVTVGVSEINGIKINANFMSMLNLDLAVTQFIIGEPIELDMPNIDDSEYAGDLTELLTNMLVGVELEAQLDLTILPGFDIAAILEAFGQTIEMPDLGIVIKDPLTISARLLVQLSMDKAIMSNSKGLLEIYIESYDLPPFINVTDAAIPFIGVYIENGKIFAEVNHIAGIKVPKVMIECDVFAILNDLLEDIDVDFVIDFGGDAPSETAGYSGGSDLDSEDDINISISPDKLQFKATLIAIMQLLESFGIVLDVPRIDLSADVSIGKLNDITVTVNAMEMLNLGLSVTKMSFGDETLVVDLQNKITRDSNGNILEDAYNKDLQSLIGDILNGIDIEANMKLTAYESFILSDFLAAFGVDLPSLNIYFDKDTVLDITMKLQMKYDADDTDNTRVLLELYVNEKVLLFNEGLLLGVYMYGNDAYINVGGKTKDGKTYNELTEQEQNVYKDKLGGIAGFHIPTVRLSTDIIDFLAVELSKIDIGFIIDQNTGNPPADGYSRAANTAEDGGKSDTSIEINKDTIRLITTMAAVQALLESLGVDIGIDLPVLNINATITSLSDIFISIDGVSTIKLDLTFSKLEFGNENMEINMPSLDDIKFADDLPSLIQEVLKGVDIEAQLQLELIGGEYDIAKIISAIVPGYQLDPIWLIIDGDGDPSNGLQNMAIDIRLKLQMSFDLVDPSNSKALFELYLHPNDNNLPNMSFAEPSATVPLLGVYILGENIYIEVNNLNDIKIPKIKIQADVMSLLADAIQNVELDFSLSLDEIINGGGNRSYRAVNTADGGSLDNPSDINIAINQDSVRFALTSMALANFLASLGVGVNLPDGIDLSGVIKNIDSSLTMEIDGKLMDIGNLHLELSKMLVGEEVNLDIQINENDYCSNAADLVESMLKGIDITGNLNLNIPAGDYDIAAFLGEIGVGGVPPIVLNFTKDVVMESEFIFKVFYDRTDPTNSKAIIEWNILNADEFIFMDVAEGVTKATLLGIYVDGDTMYVDLSNLVISNIRMPKLKIQTDIFDQLIQLIDGLGADFIIDILGGNSRAASAVADGAESDEGTPDKSGDISIAISNQALQLQITSFALQALLSVFGVYIDLPTLDLSADITDIDGITINLNAEISGNTITASLANIKAVFGERPQIDIPDGMDSDLGFGTTVIDAIINLISDVDISGKIDINANESQIDLKAILNSFLATSLESFDIPLSINFDNFSNILFIDAKWHLDKVNPSNSQLAITIHSAEGGLAISIFHDRNQLCIDLSSLGLMKFYIDQVDLVGMIKGILKDVSPMLDMDLGELINDLISGDIALMSGSNKSNSLEQMAKNALMQERIAQGIDNAQSSEEPVNIIDLIFGALKFSDTTAMLDFSDEVIKDLFEKAGIYLDLELFGSVKFDFIKGTLDGTATIDELDLGFDLNINTFGEPGSMDGNVKFADFSKAVDPQTGLYPMEDSIPNLETYSPYSLTSTLDLFINMMAAPVPNNTTPQVAIIDLFTRTNSNRHMNLANDDGYGAGGSLRLTLQRYTTDGNHNGVFVPRGGIVVGVWEEISNQYPVIWVYIYPKLDNKYPNINDPDDADIFIKGTSDLFNVSIAGENLGGELVRVPIAANLVEGVLAPLLDPILGELPDEMFIGGVNSSTDNGEVDTVEFEGENEADATASEVAEEKAADSAELDIMSLFKDINISFYETGTTKIKLEMNFSQIDTMLDDILHDLLWNLTLEDVGVENSPWPVQVDYKNNKTNGAFFNDIWSKLIKPLAINAVNGVSEGLGDFIQGLIDPLVKDDIGNIVDRVLPLPRMDNLTAEITLADSQIKSIEAATTHNSSDEFLRLNVYLTDAINSKVIDWGRISGSVVKDPYDGTKITEKYVGAKANINIPSGGVHLNAQTIVYGGDYDTLKAMDNSGIYEPKRDGGKVVPYNITATAYGVTKNIPVMILEKTPIAHFKDIVVPAYGELPTKLTAVLEDGTERVIHGLNIDVGDQRPQWQGGGVLNNVAVKDSKGAVLGSIANVTFMDASVNADSVTLEMYLDAYSKDSVISTLPDKVFVKYNAGYYSSVPVTWDTGALNGLTPDDWINGRDEPYVITAIIANKDGDQSVEQTLQYKIYIRSINGVKVRFSGEYLDDTLSVDPYAAMAERAAIDNAEANGAERPKSTVFPETAKVTYADGRSETLELEWDYAAIDNITYTVNGQKINLTIKNANGDYQWQKEVIVNVLARKVKYLDFGTAETGVVKEFNINPYEYFADNSILPNKVRAVFTEGNAMDVDVVWSIPDGAITPAGGFINAQVTISPGTTMETTVNTMLKVENIDVDGLNYPINENSVPEYTFEHAAETLYGMYGVEESLAMYAPKTLEFRLKNGSIRELPVTTNFTTAVPSITHTGGLFTGVKVTIGTGAFATTFDMDVRVPEVVLTGLAEGYETLELERDKVTSSGLGAFPQVFTLQFGDYASIVKVDWWIDNVDFNGAGGIAEIIIGKGTANEQRVQIEVVIIDNNVN